MEKYNFQAYIVPLDDQGRREWISGFTGSNGDCIITKDKVIYFISMYSAVQNNRAQEIKRVMGVFSRCVC